MSIVGRCFNESNVCGNKYAVRPIDVMPIGHDGGPMDSVMFSGDVIHGDLGAVFFLEMSESDAIEFAATITRRISAYNKRAARKRKQALRVNVVAGQQPPQPQ